MTPIDAFAALVGELNARFAADYAAAFSSKSPARVLEFYKPDAVVELHQRNRTIRLFTGGVAGALVRRALPAKLALKLLFRRLAKRGYDHSIISIISVRQENAMAVDVLFTFDRLDRTGTTFESSAAVYRLERGSGRWLIGECWVFDSLASPPPALDLSTFRPCREDATA